MGSAWRARLNQPPPHKPAPPPRGAVVLQAHSYAGLLERLQYTTRMCSTNTMCFWARIGCAGQHQMAVDRGLRHAFPAASRPAVMWIRATVPWLPPIALSSVPPEMHAEPFNISRRTLHDRTFTCCCYHARQSLGASLHHRTVRHMHNSLLPHPGLPRRRRPESARDEPTPRSSPSHPAQSQLQLTHFGCTRAIEYDQQPTDTISHQRVLPSTHPIQGTPQHRKAYRRLISGSLLGAWAVLTLAVVSALAIVTT